MFILIFNYLTMIDIMVLYCVQWFHDRTLSRGKGRATNDKSFVFTVLCESISDATRCLDYYFRFKYSEINKHGYTLDDGEIKMHRMTIDSRKFVAHYLLLPGMQEPMDLVNVRSNLLRSHRLFGS